MDARYARLEHQLGAAVAAELGKLDRAARRLDRVEWDTPSAAPARRARVAIVAADAGNVRLRLAPLRIAMARVATSEGEAPLGELVFPAELPAADLSRLLRRELPGLVDPLDAAGVDVDGLVDGAGRRADPVAAVREILEWGAVLARVGTPSPTPAVVVRDGLLRSIHFGREDFERLGAGRRRRAHGSRARRGGQAGARRRGPGQRPAPRRGARPAPARAPGLADHPHRARARAPSGLLRGRPPPGTDAARPLAGRGPRAGGGARRRGRRAGGGDDR